MVASAAWSQEQNTESAIGVSTSDDGATVTYHASFFDQYDPISALDMLPTEKEYYRFDGSLTTPPCSEGVKWHIMEQTLELSAEQIAQFTAIFEYNPVSPSCGNDPSEKIELSSGIVAVANVS